MSSKAFPHRSGAVLGCPRPFRVGVRLYCLSCAFSRFRQYQLLSRSALSGCDTLSIMGCSRKGVCSWELWSILRDERTLVRDQIPDLARPDAQRAASPICGFKQRTGPTLRNFHSCQVLYQRRDGNLDDATIGSTSRPREPAGDGADVGVAADRDRQPGCRDRPSRQRGSRRSAVDDDPRRVQRPSAAGGTAQPGWALRLSSDRAAANRSWVRSPRPASTRLRR